MKPARSIDRTVEAANRQRVLAVNGGGIGTARPARPASRRQTAAGLRSSTISARPDGQCR
jgi:hypothetical protein